MTVLSWALLAAAITGAGDVSQPVPVDSRVRVTTVGDPTSAPGADTELRRVVGRVLSAQAGSVTVQSARGAVAIPLERVVRLEVSRRGRNLKRGALIGGALGFVALTALLVAAFDADDDNAISTGDSFALGAIFGAPTGAVVGLGVGALAPAWQSVPIPRPAETGRSASFSISLRF